MMQLVVTLSTDQRDPANADDDGTRRVYVKGKLQQAVAGAIRKAGAKGLEIGGTITISYVGDDEPKRRGMSGAKLYTADYVSPSAAFLAANEAAQPWPASTGSPGTRSPGTRGRRPRPSGTGQPRRSGTGEPHPRADRAAARGPAAGHTPGRRRTVLIDPARRRAAAREAARPGRPTPVPVSRGAASR
jgi:hypothetical protein